MAPPNLPYQLGKTFKVGNKRVHTRTIFSQRISSWGQVVLQQCLNMADAALSHSVTQATVRAPGVRNGSYALGPFDGYGETTVANFANQFVSYFRVDAAKPTVVADKMDTFRHACTSIQRGLRGPLDIVDIPITRQHSTLCGYVASYRKGTKVERRGAIHLDFERVSAAKIGVAADILIHEAAHKFIAAEDKAYEHDDAKWQVLTSETALKNADSISKFVMSAFTSDLQ
jgi:hypothetical protein